MDVSKLTPEQKQELLKELEQQQAEKKRKIKEEREALKELTDESIDAAFKIIEPLSKELSGRKKQIHDIFSQVINTKFEVYDIKEDQQSHTFTNKAGTKRIVIGYHVVDNYDDTMNAGIEKVRDFLGSLGRDDNSKWLVKTVFKLLAKDQKGNLNPRNVMQLENMAQDKGDENFIDGVEIIKNAYSPVKSKQYIVASVRDEKTNAWKNIPLGMTEASY